MYQLILPGPEAADDDIKILQAIRLRSEPFATARDLEPEMEVGYKQTRNRLEDLVNRGLLNRKKVGTTNAYWLSDDGKDQLDQARF